MRHATEVLLISHRAYGNLLLQPGGHLEPDDTTLMGAALRELQEETGIDPSIVVPAALNPVYIEYGQVPARPDRDEPAHHHLDFGFAFTTDDATIGRIQESDLTYDSWYPLDEAERIVGSRISRATRAHQA